MHEDHKPISDKPGSGGPRPSQRGVPMSAVWAAFLAALGFLATLPALKSYADGEVHSQWLSWVLLAAGLAALFGAIVLILRLRVVLARLGPEKLWRVLTVAAVGVIPLLALIGVTFAGIDISNTLSGNTLPTGTIIYPAPGTPNVPSPKTLDAAGTVQHLQPGHHLVVFLQFGAQNRYWSGDLDVVVSASGHWAGTVCIGYASPITLVLVDLGPKGLAALKDNPNYEGSGVPFLPTKLASDVSILDSISATAVATKTACIKHEPVYY